MKIYEKYWYSYYVTNNKINVYDMSNNFKLIETIKHRANSLECLFINSNKLIITNKKYKVKYYLSIYLIDVKK
jgi:hypothetical protein